MNYVDELRDLADVIDAEDSKAVAAERFADRVLDWQREHRKHQGEELSFAEIDRRIGRGNDYTARIVRWRTSSARSATPFSDDPARDRRAAESHTRKVLREAGDEQVKEIVASLPAEAVERMVEKGTERLVENARAKRGEHETESTAKDLMGDDRFDPAEYWADTLIIRLNRNARELSELQERAGGLLLGSMEKEEAFEYMQDTERRVAEARAAVQAQLRDELEV